MTSSTTALPLLRCGVCAVPVFFVLSGFVMWKILSQTAHGVGPASGFLGKRLLRIFPAYWFFLALTLLAVRSGLNTWDGAGSPGRDWTAAVVLLSSSPAPTLPISAAWSLIYEMIFYYVLCLFVFNRRLGAIAIFLYFLWSLCLEHLFRIQICGLYPINVLFLAGLLLGTLDQHHPHFLPKLVPLLFLGLLMALTYIVTGIRWRGWLAYSAGPLIVAGVLGLERSYAPKMNVALQKTLQFLGTISFSLYVGHTLAQSLLLEYMGEPTLLTAPLFVAGPIAIATLSFVLIEKPAMDFARWMDLTVFSPGSRAPARQTTQLTVPEPQPAKR